MVSRFLQEQIFFHEPLTLVKNVFSRCITVNFRLLFSSSWSSLDSGSVCVLRASAISLSSSFFFFAVLLSYLVSHLMTVVLFDTNDSDTGEVTGYEVRTYVCTYVCTAMHIQYLIILLYSKTLRYVSYIRICMYNVCT